MASAPIPVEEYLRSTCKPACEYIDGVLRQKPLPAYKHSKLQLRTLNLINQSGAALDAVPELTVRIREGKYLIPDVGVQRIGEIQEPYPTKPIYLCIEVLSPEDRFSDVVAKCEDYHSWGVRYCWIIDPETQQCWEYEAGSRPHQVLTGGKLTTADLALHVTDLFTYA